MFKTSVVMKKSSWTYVIEVEGQERLITRTSKTMEYSHAVLVKGYTGEWYKWSFAGRLDLAQKSEREAAKNYETKIVELPALPAVEAPKAEEVAEAPEVVEVEEVKKEDKGMYCFYVYHGKNRGAISADTFEGAKEKFEAANPTVKVKKVRNAHSGEMKMFTEAPKEEVVEAPAEVSEEVVNTPAMRRTKVIEVVKRALSMEQGGGFAGFAVNDDGSIDAGRSIWNGEYYIFDGMLGEEMTKQEAHMLMLGLGMDGEWVEQTLDILQALAAHEGFSLKENRTKCLYPPCGNEINGSEKDEGYCSFDCLAAHEDEEREAQEAKVKHYYQEAIQRKKTTVYDIELCKALTDMLTANGYEFEVKTIMLGMYVVGLVRKIGWLS